jgi:cytochrome P450
VVANAYAIHQNESKYPNPNIFEPERYINYSLSAVDAANLRDAEERDHWAYGAGRRICAGIHVAEVSLFIVCSRLLWGFNMSLSKDAAGKDIPIDDMRYNGK